jgi:CHRD domain-containing protein
MRKLALAVSVGLLGAIVLISTTAVATGDGGKSFRTKLTGYEEIIPASFSAGPPPTFAGEAGAVSTMGSGKFTATVRKNPLRIDFRLRYQNLEGTITTQAHIHFGQKHTVGGVSTFLCGGGTKPTPCPPTSGEVSGTINAADVGGPTNQGIEATNIAELVAAMQAGVTYVNVHTNKWPGGEIRGQLDGRGDDD